ncbi:unnamed protein product [Rhizophagus irregularis]|nr:unnamed protein product [Rhizophagus irregularis]
MEDAGSIRPAKSLDRFRSQPCYKPMVDYFGSLTPRSNPGLPIFSSTVSYRNFVAGGECMRKHYYEALIRK